MRRSLSHAPKKIIRVFVSFLLSLARRGPEILRFRAFFVSRCN